MGGVRGRGGGRVGGSVGSVGKGGCDDELEWTPGADGGAATPFAELMAVDTSSGRATERPSSTIPAIPANAPDTDAMQHRGRREWVATMVATAASCTAPCSTFSSPWAPLARGSATVSSSSSRANALTPPFRTRLGRRDPALLGASDVLHCSVCGSSSLKLSGGTCCIGVVHRASRLT